MNFFPKDILYLFMNSGNLLDTLIFFETANVSN